MIPKMDDKSLGSGKLKQLDTPVWQRLKIWGKTFVDDLRKVQLLPLKALMFLIYGANLALIPFLSLQARSIGITGEEVGQIYSFLAIPALLVPPIVGMVADRVGNFKLLIVILSFWRNMTEDGERCLRNVSNKLRKITAFWFSKYLLSAATLLSGLLALLFIVVPAGRINHQLPKDVSVNLSCSHLGDIWSLDNTTHCQTLPEMTFSVEHTNCFTICESKINADVISSETICSKEHICSFNVSGSSFLTPKTLDQLTSVETKSLPHHNNSQQFSNRTEYELISNICPALLKDAQLTDKSCKLVCEGTALRSNACLKSSYIEELNPSLTFYSHLVVRFLFEITLASSMPLTEGALVTVVKKYDGDFGFQRLYSNLGMMVMTPVTGILLDQLSTESGHANYNIAIYIYCTMKLIAAAMMLTIDLEFKVAAETIIADFWKLLHRYEVMAFLVATLIAGQLYGYMETFLFWLLEDLGADRTLMGFTITVGSASGVIMLLGSTYILKKLGYINTLAMGFGFYIVRFVGYTLISSPWWAMPFELMEAVTTSLMLVTFISYSAHLATPTTIVSLQGIYMGLYNGVGRATGTMIGGYLINHFGILKTFRILAVCSGISGVIYMTFNMLFFRSSVTKVSKNNLKRGDPLGSIQAGTPNLYIEPSLKAMEANESLDKSITR